MSSPTVRGRRALKESSLSPPPVSPQAQQSPENTKKIKNNISGLEGSPRLKKSSPKKGKHLQEEDYSSDEEQVGEDEPDRALLQKTPDLQSKEYYNYDNTSTTPVRSGGERIQCSPRTSRIPKHAPVHEHSPRSCNFDAEESKNRRKKENDLTVAPIFYLFAMLCLLVFVVFVLPELTKPSTEPIDENKIKSIQDVHKDVKSSLKALHNDLPQSRHVWTQLMGQINSVMVDKPSQPAVIVVVVAQGAQRTATCFVDKVATAIMDAFDGEHRHIMYDVKSELHGMEQANFKWELNQALQGLSTKHVAIIHNIERIPGHAAMTFHAYCDNENAPHKQAVLLLTLEIANNYEDITEDVLDYTIDNQLMKLWSKDLRETDVAAIISRMANSPILIKPEPDFRINELCPKI